jgi:hypothetical protein
MAAHCHLLPTGCTDAAPHGIRGKPREDHAAVHGQRYHSLDDGSHKLADNNIFRSASRSAF